MSNIKNWSTTAASNNSASPNGAPEGMPPSAVNDIMRQQMADHRTQWQDAEWFDWGHVPTRTGNSTFTVPTDLTSVYTSNRRLKCSDASTIYASILSSSYTAVTTVTVVTDSGNLSASLSSVAVSIMTNGNSQIRSDAYPVVAGSSDASKKLRIEVDGFTTATTRVLTPPDADLTLPAVTAKGDVVVATASGVLSKVALGSAGSIPMSRAAATTGLAYVAALNKAIYGLTYANGTDATNDIDIAAGGCMDSTGAYWITLSAITKQLDASWAVGTNAGGLDTGSIGNSDYFIWAIARSDTGVTDALFSLSATAPTMPANYDFKRLIGWFRRSAGAILAIYTLETSGGGLEYMWASPILDYNSTFSTTASLKTLSVPSGIRVKAKMNVYFTGDNNGAYISSPDVTDLAPSVTVSPLATIYNSTDSPFDNVAAQVFCYTNTSAQVRTRALSGTPTVYIATRGFEWARRD